MILYGLGLRRVKEKYDPYNLFDYPQGIK
ncbi:BBE domain-containing protein [Clostridium paridis]|uniref:BBE domain-containing protein n=1 Tax=Clostridium paridis TaxID=2803863 RepID=A0A937FD46_9CLOT|nr:BBE domain-containing protein [Clostridium paridis]